MFHIGIWPAGIGFDLSAKIFSQALAVILNGIRESMQIIVSVTSMLLGNTLDTISSLPKWAWGLILGALASVVILAIVSKDFQDKVGEAISKVLNGIETMFSNLLESVEYMWRGIREILILLWNLGAPAILPELIVIVGVALEINSRVDAPGTREL